MKKTIIMCMVMLCGSLLVGTKVDAKVKVIKYNNIKEYMNNNEPTIAYYDVKSNTTTIYSGAEIDDVYDNNIKHDKVKMKEPDNIIAKIQPKSYAKWISNIQTNGIELYSNPPTIIGSDNRSLVNESKRYTLPVCATAYLSVRHKDGSYSSGTGFQIGERLFATAGHMLVNKNGSFPHDTLVEFGKINGTANYTYHSSDIEGYIWIGGANGTFNSDNDYGFIVFKSDISDNVGYCGIDFNYTVGNACSTYGYPAEDIFDDSMIYCSGSITSKYYCTIETNLDSSEGQSGSPVLVNGGYSIGILHGGDGNTTYARQLDSGLVDWLDQNGYFD